jgi:hypothetical protein
MNTPTLLLWISKEDAVPVTEVNILIFLYIGQMISKLEGNFVKVRKSGISFRAVWDIAEIYFGN